MPFSATWRDLEIVLLSDVSQTEKENPFYVDFLKKRYK